MGHDLDLVTTLAGALVAALVLGFAAHEAGLSPIVGYLAAGIVVGPFTPGFVAHSGLASQMGELGVILLMFGVGLNLHVSELVAVRRVAIPGALLGIGGAVLGGFLVTRLFGWSVTAGIVYGLALAAASTVVLLRVFADRDLLQTQPGHIAIGWLLVEDVAVVLAVVLLPVLTSGASHGAALAASIALAVAKVGGLVVFTIFGGRRLVPRVLGYVARTRSRELFTLAVLAIALGVAVGASALFGASMALGAFLAGLVVGQSDYGSRAGSEALPMRDAFAVLFFVSTGMLLDPHQIVERLPLTVATLAVVWTAKPLVAFVLVRAMRYPPRTAIALALGLGQIGEFSFLLAGLGGRLGVLPSEATQSLVAVAIVSITLNPILLRLVGPMSTWLGARAEAEEGITPSPVEPQYRAIIVGYGPIGRSLAALLVENGIEPTIIELNHETVAALRERNVKAVYGDASQREILERAGVAGAGSLVHTASGPSAPVIECARAMNPSLRILTRASHQRDVPSLEKAGADHVVSSEVEVALAMTERILEGLGATADQLDRERDRVRARVEGVRTELPAG
jgi:CPA2 family monovalent cation:H+ antiporter-2